MGFLSREQKDLFFMIFRKILPGLNLAGFFLGPGTVYPGG
jgi:hypothetical protein